MLLLQAPKSTLLHVEEGHGEQDTVLSVHETLRLKLFLPIPHSQLQPQLSLSPCCANRWQMDFLTQCILEVLLSYQLEVFLNSFGSKCVLPEDQDIMFSTTIYLSHHQICQEVLREKGQTAKVI